MEKVKITKCDLIMGGKAHGVTLEDGRQCTAWNDKINGGDVMQAYASHSDCLVELKPYDSNGKQGLNMIKFQMIENVSAGELPSVGNVEALLPKGKTPTTNESIVAQCMVKGAVELAKKLGMDDIQNNETLGQFLCMAVIELSGAYKVALEHLE